MMMNKYPRNNPHKNETMIPPIIVKKLMVVINGIKGISLDINSILLLNNIFITTSKKRTIARIPDAIPK
jgi:hypothetical protein